MIAAVMIAVGIMMASAETISAFVHKHPTVKMLALSFLLLIGMSLILEGFDHRIPKGYIYFAMGFSVFVEMINLRLRKATKPVHLHERYTDRPPPADPGPRSLEGPLMSYLMLVVTIVAQAAAACSPPPSTCPSVYDTRRGAFTDFESMGPIWLAPTSCSSASSTTMGDASAREALLGGLRRRKVAPTVSLEMFERDVQGVVDGYLAGSIPESQFLQESRPWPRYATDYRPLVEMAKSEGWTVVAANLPRRVASAVAKSGSRRSNSCRR